MEGTKRIYPNMQICIDEVSNCCPTKTRQKIVDFYTNKGPFTIRGKPTQSVSIIYSNIPIGKKRGNE